MCKNKILFVRYPSISNILSNFATMLNVAICSAKNRIMVIYKPINKY